MAAVKDCKQVCDESGIALQGIEGQAKPTFESFLVAFGGGCEPFVVQCVCGNRGPERPSYSQPDRCRGFCKTEHLPYDICVQACLIVLNHNLGDAFQVGSDGNEVDWDGARELCQKTLGYGLDFRLAVE